MIFQNDDAKKKKQNSLNRNDVITKKWESNEKGAKDTTRCVTSLEVYLVSALESVIVT